MRQEEKAPSSRVGGGPEEKEPLGPRKEVGGGNGAQETGQAELPCQKREELEASLLEERRKSEDYLKRLMYLQADFENYRRRVEKDIENAALLSKEKLILNLLGIVDELELAVRAGEKTDNKDAITEGVKVTLKKFYDLLRSEGVETIDAVGKPFDPKLHEAASTTPKEGCKTPVVSEEIRKGFVMDGKVIRPSIVTVETPAAPLQTVEKSPLAVAGEGERSMVKGNERPAVQVKVKGDEREKG
ncbi:MAG: nucleotide exchange factor GrpE [Candidatus Brockarchaeota archaeon]|nr:nucleotide exchange factor GrpE [Candidatus Brockarchaeota archaeon]